MTFRVDRGEIFALLGPNGGGKTTLFKILSTLMRPTSGTVHVLGHDLGREAPAVRPRLGVVFQNPGLDPKLTVAENLVHHGHLYGLGGASLRERVKQVLGDLDLTERADDLVETLSGGLARRTELARGLLHAPELLLLDEPSTGLDPGARRDFSQHLRELRDRAGVTVVLTTHYMEEAERADRVAVLHEGSLVALGTADELKRSVGGDVVVIEAEAPADLREKVRASFGLEAQVVDGTLRVERAARSRARTRRRRGVSRRGAVGDVRQADARGRVRARHRQTLLGGEREVRGVMTILATGDDALVAGGHSLRAAEEPALRRVRAAAGVLDAARRRHECLVSAFGRSRRHQLRRVLLSWRRW